jgi:diadenosine tetraphosphate (Ap4A) HIT family hydrolase
MIKKYVITGAIMISTTAGGLVDTQIPLLSHQVIEENNTISVNIPKIQLANRSLQVAPLEDKPYVSWTDEDHSNVYHSLQKTVAIWKENNIADQYMIYGKQESGSKAFSWEAVPYQKTSNIFARFWQQLQVLWRITFGGMTTSDAQKQQQVNEYTNLFENYVPTVTESAEKVMEVSSRCPFCKEDVIDKQLVIEGRKVNVLFNYAPIGFGGEKLHFLVVPKDHKKNFGEVSEEEYVEASQVSQELIQFFNRTRSVEDVYMFHKTGADAGQTVPHWHQHIILTTSKTQDVFGKLTVLKNMLFGTSPMKDPELARRVQSLKLELYLSGSDESL